MKDVSDTLSCVFCTTELTEPEEVEIHGDLCHECAWGMTKQSQYQARKQKREGKPFTFNSNNHHTGCTCPKCKT